MSVIGGIDNGKMYCEEHNWPLYWADLEPVVLDCDDDMSNGAIYIYDIDGVEIHSWTEDEWKEDPTVVMAICNAIKLRLTYGPDYMNMLNED